MRTVETIQQVNNAVKKVNSTKFSTYKKNRIIKAIKNAKYNGISCQIVGYNIRINKKPLELANYLIKLETSRTKSLDTEILAF